MTAAAWVQAVATVVLVAVTWAYVRLTNRSLKVAQDSSRVSQRALILDVAPIILPLRTVGSGSVTGSLQNIGGRAAIEIDSEAFLGDTRVGVHSEPLINPGQQKRWHIDYDPNQPGVLANAPFTINCTYRSITGDTFRTTKRYHSEERHDFEVFLQEGDTYRRLSITKVFDEDA